MTNCTRLVVACLGFLFVPGIIGCGSGESGPRRSMAEVGKQLEAQSAADTQQAAKAEMDRQAQETQATESAAAQQPSGDRQKVGDRPPMEGGGYFAAIAGARRHVLNVVDSLSWIQGVRNFKGEKGRKPKDTAEFMKDVVVPYELQLPALEEGQEYVYDPDGETEGDFGQLYVVNSQTDAAPATP